MADRIAHMNGEPHNAESTVNEAYGASQIGPFDYCPKLGFREYWYAGVEARKLRRAPVHLKLLGEDLVFFRDKAGKVVALSDWCPHRGARLSLGLCEFEGTVTCPYHGYVFDGTGQCVAGLIERPDSPFVPKLRARTFPTEERMGIVFVWMGETAPVPLEDDLPAELLAPAFTGARYLRVKVWEANGTEPVAQGIDFHEFYLHRGVNVWRLFNYRLPFFRQKIVHIGGVRIASEGETWVNAAWVAPHTGQAYYPGLGAKWPRHVWWRRLPGNAGYRGGNRAPGKPRNTRTSEVYTPTRVEVTETLERAQMLPAIVFIFSRAGCDEAVDSCTRAGLNLTTEEESETIREFAEQRAATIERQDLRALRFNAFMDGLQRGIAAHHAGMLPIFKETVEELFAMGLVKLVFATETLSLGINMPARTVVIERLEKWDGTRHELLTAGQYTQLTGRAGRRGLDRVGDNVLLLAAQGDAHWQYFNLGLTSDPAYLERIREIARRLERLEGGAAHANRLLASVAVHSGDMREGLRRIEKAVELDPSDTFSLVIHAITNLLAGRIERATRSAARLAEIDPLQLMTHDIQAIVLMMDGRSEAALPHARQAYLMEPANPAATHIYALVLAGTGRRAEAIDVLERLEQFAEHGATFSEVLRYYGARIPLLASRVVPMALMVGSALIASLLLSALAALGSGMPWYPGIFAEMIYVWTALALFLATGATLRAHRDELDLMEGLDDAEQRELRERQDQWQKTLDRAYASVRSGLPAQAYRTVKELIESEGDSLEIYQWTFNGMLAWDDSRHAAMLGERFAKRLWDEGRKHDALELVRFLELETVAHTRVASLPFGTRKRVELARALASHPKLLLLDEPAGGLNHEEVAAIGRLIAAIRAQRGVTVLLVEHHMSLVMSVSEHVVVLDFGRKIAEGPPDAVRSDPEVVRAYLGTRR